MSVEFQLREMVSDDRNYVLSSWLRSYALSREARDYASVRHYFEDYEPLVHSLIDRSTVVVACMPEEPDVVLGWMAIEDENLHYLLVKPRWRRLGIASDMVRDLKGERATYTHRTPLWDRFPVGEQWEYRRFRVYRKE